MSNADTEAILLDSVAMQLVRGKTTAAVRDWAIKPVDSQGLGLPWRLADRIIAQARARITSVAAVDRDEQLGLAIAQLKEIYAAAIEGRDLSKALAARKELNELLGLNGSTDPIDTSATLDAARATQELESVRGYLEPLRLAAEGSSVSELARLAVQMVVDLRAGRK